MESAPSRRWSGELPARAGYVQLPQHLVWMEGEGETPESIDGFFWTAPTPGSEIHVLLAAGLHADRAGFSVVPLPPASLDRAEEWADRPGSEDGVDFRSRMPGAHFERLYRVGTPGEVLKLVSRVFAFMDDRGAPEPRAPSTSTSAPRPSTLSYQRIAVD